MGEVCFMKTKIVYISGNELFELSDIRAALDDIHNALGLDSDTVLIAVPIDKAKDGQTATNSASAATEINNKSIKKIDRKKSTHAKQTALAQVADEKNIKSAENQESPENIKKHSEKMRPILSVLSTQDAQNVEIPVEKESATDDFAKGLVGSDSDSEIQIESESALETTSDSNFSEEVLESGEPAKSAEKSLEELLETMTPLSEDYTEEEFPNLEDENATAHEKTNEVDDIKKTFQPEKSNDEMDDSDTTLEQLANEFAKSEDKIVATSKNHSHGKIGKLKNILPFKKVKHDNSGLIGDLFGWAGIAANDEDFSMPEFFTGIASKK